MANPVSTRFQNTPCSVVVGNNFDTHGTITRASVQHLTPSQLEALFKTGANFHDMTAWFRTQFEMKACGTKINGFYEWLMSSAKDIGEKSPHSLMSSQKVQKGPSLLFPFVMARQDSVVNVDQWWAVVAGWAQSAYPVGAAPLTQTQLDLGVAGDRVVRVVNRYGVDLDDKWFINRDFVYIVDRSSGQTRMGQWKVLASAVATDLSYIDILIVNHNNGSPTPYNATPTGSALLVAGGNNVNDFESYCQNRPTIDPRKRVPFWYQTMRRTRSVDSEYRAVFERLMESNEAFREFGDLPLAERNRQDEEMFQRRWVHSFFFGKKISGNQTLANWQALESILTGTGSVIDPGLGGKQIAYRANMIGVFEQLVACDRWRDLQNGALNFYEWLDENYRVLRSRKSQGRTVDTIDWFTDQVFAANLESAFIAYLKKEYGDIVRINIETGTNELGFSWKIFKPKFPAVKIAIVTHEFFDDMVNAFDAESIGSAGRVLLCLDIGKPGPRGGTIYPGMIASNRKQATLGDLSKLSPLDRNFACTMEYITEDITHSSETVTAIVECPSNSLWISGIADAVPVTTGKNQAAGSNYYDLYSWIGFALTAAATIASSIC